MALINRLRTRFHQRFLEKEIPLHHVSRGSVFLETAKSVGLLFDATSPLDTKVVLDFEYKLKQQGKKVKLLGYFGQKLKEEKFEFDIFTKKQLDWALRPKEKVALDFAKQPFDLLINLSKRSVLPLDYLAARSKARYRVGPYTERTSCYDLMIEPNKESGLKDFLGEVLHYLEKMQPAFNSTNSAKMTVTG